MSALSVIGICLMDPSVELSCLNEVACSFFPLCDQHLLGSHLLSVLMRLLRRIVDLQCLSGTTAAEERRDRQRNIQRRPE